MANLSLFVLLLAVIGAANSYTIMTKDYEFHEYGPPVDPADPYTNIDFESFGDVIVYGQYLYQVNLTGWNFLFIKTSSAYDDIDQAHAAGYFEGYHSYLDIWYAWNNFVEFFTPDSNLLPSGVQDFITKQNQWIDKMVAQNPSDDYWVLVNATFTQLRGMYDGYQQAIKDNNVQNTYNLTFDEFYYLANAGDLEDLLPAFKDELKTEGDCTGFIKLTERQLYTGHNTFNMYTFMLRIYKTVEISYKNPLVRNHLMMFSSRPGDLTSKDDFYMLSNNFVVIETSLNNYNKSNYGFLTPETVPCWIRQLVANRAMNNT
mmetsp:Transcript_35393/g.31867  ORF Transcript_35393/g.31867 Transcript_35393/m.31867 type:complete len:316 (-) Transcript_35393:749-1696(-)